MSFSSIIEDKLSQKIGRSPCQNTDSNFFYEIITAKKVRDCICLVLSITVKGCLDEVLLQICNLEIDLEWNFLQDDEEDNVYIASVVLSDICVFCDDKKITSKIEDATVNIEETKSDKKPR